MTTRIVGIPEDPTQFIDNETPEYIHELREIRFNYIYANGQIHYDFYCVGDKDEEDYFGTCKKITLDYDGAKTTARVEFDTGYIIEVYDVKLSIFK